MSDISRMLAPVRCAHCSGVYDSSDVEVVQGDSMYTAWIAPCCGRTVEDHPLALRSDFTRLY